MLNQYRNIYTEESEEKSQYDTKTLNIIYDIPSSNNIAYECNNGLITTVVVEFEGGTI